jgi:hypothetical protein
VAIVLISPAELGTARFGRIFHDGATPHFSSEPPRRPRSCHCVGGAQHNGVAAQSNRSGNGPLGPGLLESPGFRYNPDDPALWDPAEVGPGAHADMARPASWAIVCLLIVIVTTVQAPGPWRGVPPLIVRAAMIPS